MNGVPRPMKLSDLNPKWIGTSGNFGEAQRRFAKAETFALTERSAESLDAERYRYLRNIAGQIAEDDDGPMVCDGLGDNFEFLRGVEVDASVDAAMDRWKAAGSPTPLPEAPKT